MNPPQLPVDWWRLSGSDRQMLRDAGIDPDGTERQTLVIVSDDSDAED